jgi:hypothetical protein
MTIHQVVKTMDRNKLLFIFFNGQAQISILIFVRINAVYIFPPFLRVVENRPQPLDLRGLEDAGH